MKCDYMKETFCNRSPPTITIKVFSLFHVIFFEWIITLIYSCLLTVWKRAAVWFQAHVGDCQRKS